MRLSKYVGHEGLKPSSLRVCFAQRGLGALVHPLMLGHSYHIVIVEKLLLVVSVPANQFLNSSELKKEINLIQCIVEKIPKSRKSHLEPQ